MANIGAIRRALKTRIGSFTDVTVYAFVPDGVNVPCLVIEPSPSDFIDYEQILASGRSEMQFVIRYMTNRIDDESAQDQIDEMLDPEGQLVTNLRAKGVGDELEELVSYVEVLTAKGYGTYRVGGTSYFGIQLMITVMV